MKKIPRWILQALAGIVIALGQAIVVAHNLIDSDPFKTTYLDGFYERVAYVGVPVAFLMAVAVLLVAKRWLDMRWSPFIPAVLFPIFFWIIYKVAFSFGGHELNWEGGRDFSTMSSELELADELINWLITGVAISLAAIGFNILYFREDGPGADGGKNTGRPVT